MSWKGVSSQLDVRDGEALVRLDEAGEALVRLDEAGEAAGAFAAAAAKVSVVEPSTACATFGASFPVGLSQLPLANALASPLAPPLLMHYAHSPQMLAHMQPPSADAVLCCEQHAPPSTPGLTPTGQLLFGMGGGPTHHQSALMVQHTMVLQNAVVVLGPNNVRRGEVVAAERSTIAFPAGLPTNFPFSSDGFPSAEAAAIAAFELFLGDIRSPAPGTLRHACLNNLSGAYGLRIKERLKASSTPGHLQRGLRWRIVCNSEGLEKRPVTGVRESVSSRTGCKVVLYIEQCESSLELTADCVFEHNHQLRTTNVQKAALAFTKDHLSPTQIEFAVKLQKFGVMSVADIARLLRAEAEQSGESVKWSDQDLAGHLTPDPETIKRELDAELLLDQLVKGKAAGTFADFSVDRDEETNRLRGVAVFFREASVVHARHGRPAVIYNHGFATNVWGLKLGTFVGLRSDKQPTVFGLTFVAREDLASFRWALRAYREFFGAPPSVLVSDGDRWLAEAVALEFGALYALHFHLLCLWHLAQGLFTNVAHCFSAAAAGKRGDPRLGWVKMHRAFWSLARKSDWQSTLTFSEEFEAMHSLVEAQRTEANRETIDKALRWLGNSSSEEDDPCSLFARRRRWAARYTHALFTFGADAAQSGEAIFKAIKSEAKPHLPFQPLCKSVLRLVDKREFRALVAEFKAQLVSAVRTVVEKPPLLVDLEKRLRLSETALKICTAQSARAETLAPVLLNAAQTSAFLSAKSALSAVHVARAKAADAAIARIAAAATLADAKATSAAAIALEGADALSALSVAEASSEELALLGAIAEGAAQEEEASFVVARLAENKAYDALQQLNLNDTGAQAEAQGGSQPDPGAKHVRYYFVRCTEAQGSASLQALADVSAADKNALDYGLQTSLEDLQTCHVASSEDCTCQMRSHLGLPCRHTQRVWQEENLAEVPDAAVDPRWLRREDELDHFPALEQLRADACARARAPPSLAEQRLMTADERCADLTGLCAVLCDVGALTPALYKQVGAELRAHIESVKLRALTPDSPHGSRAQTAAGAPLSLETDLEADLKAVKAAKKAESTVKKAAKDATPKRKREVATLLSTCASRPAKAEALAALQLGLGTSASLRARAVVAGVLPPLVSLLREGSPEEKEHSARAIESIAVEDELRKRIADENALPPLVSLLQTGSAEGKWHAAAALSNLAKKDELRARIVVAGALTPLVSLLQTGSAEGEKNATGALSNLACQDALRARIVQAGALTPLVSLLQTGSAEGKANAAGALWNLACNHALRARIAEAGVLLPLVSLLQTDSAQGVTRAAGALQAIGSQQALRKRVIDSGAAGALLAVARQRAGSDEAAAAVRALKAICPGRGEMQQALVAREAQVVELTAEIASLRQREADRVRRLASLASAVGEKTADLDVTFRCAEGGRELGASRLLLTRSSHFYRSLFGAMAESASNVVVPDKDFPMAAHEALLRQLHACGQLPLPEEPALLCELLALCAKMRSLSAGGDEVEDVVAQVAVRCESALIASLDVGNCLDVLMRFKLGGACARLVDAAHTLATERVAELVQQPSWEAFVEKLPRDACQLLQRIALATRTPWTPSGPRARTSARVTAPDLHDRLRLTRSLELPRS